jgi:hypothetical protein
MHWPALFITRPGRHCAVWMQRPARFWVWPGGHGVSARHCPVRLNTWPGGHGVSSRHCPVRLSTWPAGQRGVDGFGVPNAPEFGTTIGTSGASGFGGPQPGLYGHLGGFGSSQTLSGGLNRLSILQAAFAASGANTTMAKLQTAISLKSNFNMAAPVFGTNKVIRYPTQSRNQMRQHRCQNLRLR